MGQQWATNVAIPSPDVMALVMAVPSGGALVEWCHVPNREHACQWNMEVHT